MSIAFERQGRKFLLSMSPENFPIKVILDKFKSGESWTISRIFVVKEKHLHFKDIDQNEIEFCIGAVQEEYTLIDRDVLGTKHNFYFSNSIKLNKRHFVAYRNISILAKIDEVADRDVYIGGEHDEDCIPIEVFELLIKKFPKTAELNHYAKSRIATIIKEFYPGAEQYEVNFDKFLERQERSLSSALSHNTQNTFKANIEIELTQFIEIRENLRNLLERADSVNEKVWQEQIHGLLRLLYPKYIAGFREVGIKGVDKYEKRPDFLLVDANGYIDILEIKIPSVQLLTKQASYRNNYVPVRDLAGAVQQIEKYIYCLNAWGEEGEKKLKEKLSEKLPPEVIPKIVNPQGILLLGRSDQFNRQQKTDFELIKRQYKHVAEIMTYDDLLKRIDNIISALKLEKQG